MRTLYRERPIARMCVSFVPAERDEEETYRTWLPSGVPELSGKGATGSACYSGRVSKGT